MAGPSRGPRPSTFFPHSLSICVGSSSLMDALYTVYSLLYTFSQFLVSTSLFQRCVILHWYHTQHTAIRVSGHSTLDDGYSRRTRQSLLSRPARCIPRASFCLTSVCVRVFFFFIILNI